MGGIAFGGGYSLMLGEHINLDFGLGLWTGYQKYVTYACPQCGKVVDSGEKWFSVHKHPSWAVYAGIRKIVCCKFRESKLYYMLINY